MSEKLPKTITIHHPERAETIEVSAEKYINAKTKSLQEFGYTNLTETEVENQLKKILNGDKDLDVIGMFMESDIVVKKQYERSK